MGLAYFALAGRILLSGYEKIIFKQVGENTGSEEAIFLIFSTGVIFLLPFVFTAPFPQDYGFLWIALLAGLVYTVQTVLYIKALSQGEASLVSPVYYFGMFFLLVLTSVFLGETPGLFKITGLVLLIYGMSFLNRKQNILLSLKAIVTNRACQFMMGSSLLVAVGRTVDGFMVRSIHPVIYTFFLCLATLLFLFIHLSITRRFGKVKQLFREKWKAGAVAGGVDCYSYLLLMFAIRHIEVSIAEPATMLGMIVTVVLAHFIFGEQLRNRLLGVTIMIAGAWLLFV